MHSSFGWDLAAYGESSYSALCEGKLDESRFTATMLRCNAISNPKLVMTLNLSETVANERRVLVACCAKAEFFVDIPIDLRPLLDVVNFSSKFTANNYWQLVRRPIDQALGGLTPLADFIGYPVARIANLLRGFKDPGPVELNRTLFETYPAANLELIRCNNERVQRVYDKYRWVSGLKAKEPKNWPAWLQAALKDHLGDSLELTKNEREKLVALVLEALGMEKQNAFSIAANRGLQGETITRSDKPPYKGGVARFRQSRWVAKEKAWTDQCLAELLNALGFTACTDEEECNADEFDAMICSVIGCFPECTMSDDELKKIVKQRLEKFGANVIADELLVPAGYRVLRQWPQNVSFVIARQKLNDVDELCEYVQSDRSSS